MPRPFFTSSVNERAFLTSAFIWVWMVLSVISAPMTPSPAFNRSSSWWRLSRLFLMATRFSASIEPTSPNRSPLAVPIRCSVSTGVPEPGMYFR